MSRTTPRSRWQRFARACRCRYPKAAPAWLLLVATNAAAELVAITSANDSADGQLETIVVTAHRTPLSASRVGSSVSVIDRTLINQRQNVFATDLLRDLPSVAVSRAGGFGAQTQVRIRGAEANHVMVMIDGVEANDPAGPDEFDFATLTAFDIESIELVRGPQSALWGSDATAGVINITTRRGSQPLGAGLFLEGGSFGTLHGGGRLSTASERGGIDLSVSHLNTRGTKTAANGSENDGVENTTLTLRGRWQAMETADLSAFARYSDATVEFDDFDFATGLPADADRESDDELLLLGASARVTLFDERWSQSLRLTLLDSSHQRASDGLDAGFTGAEKRGIYYQSTWQITPEKHQLVVAIDHEQEKFKQRGEPSAFGDPNQNQKMHSTGYVAEYLGQPLANLTVSASARHDDNSDFDGVTTYRVTSSYLLEATGTRLRASYGTGQKSPTFVERFGNFADQFVGNPQLNPEKSKGFEVGLEQRLLGGRLLAEAAYFNETLEDEINGFVFDLATFSLTAQNMDGRSKRKGVELQIAAALSENFQARASYTYTDSTQPNAQGQPTREVRRPTHMAAINLNYALLNARANVNLNASYTGSQTDEIFPPPFFEPTRVPLGDYTLVDLAASYALTEKATLYARVENLMNESYSDIFGFAAPGRGAYAGIKLQL